MRNIMNNTIKSPYTFKHANAIEIMILRAWG